MSKLQVPYASASSHKTLTAAFPPAPRRNHPRLRKMASTPVQEAADGPVLSLINKRLRALKKKYNRILQMEESIAQGKPINKEQEEVLRSKPSVSAAIDELEKLRAPLSSALSEELDLALRRQPQPQPQPSSPSVPAESDSAENHESKEGGDGAVEDLLNLLYFGSLFDVDFTATMLSRAHERGCCLTYDTVTDEATDLLGDRDLDLISMLGGLLVSRPPHSSLSHKNALQKCIEHAKLWLSNSDSPIDPNAGVSYAGLRERLNKIMASDYFTITPAINSSAEVAAAAAAVAGNYASFQVPVPIPVQVEDPSVQYQHEVEEAENFQEHEIGDNRSIPAEELQQNFTG
ncbi:hypothetical protein Tsubulata_035091 [Turnera subulata]|uniref:Uncharacterized protein n=1 Tax=Turnera subulata TaxID=218843 RepID=A0A9Q0FFD5_9ROSI|nr:hypothetical protein Tsubulata_035091 [Turnera subulata]